MNEAAIRLHLSCNLLAYDWRHSCFLRGGFFWVSIMSIYFLSTQPGVALLTGVCPSCRDTLYLYSKWRSKSYLGMLYANQGLRFTNRAHELWKNHSNGHVSWLLASKPFQYLSDVDATVDKVVYHAMMVWTSEMKCVCFPKGLFASGCAICSLNANANLYVWGLVSLLSPTKTAHPLLKPVDVGLVYQERTPYHRCHWIRLHELELCFSPPYVLLQGPELYDCSVQRHPYLWESVQVRLYMSCTCFPFTEASCLEVGLQYTAAATNSDTLSATVMQRHRVGRAESASFLMCGYSCAWQN